MRALRSKISWTLVAAALAGALSGTVFFIGRGEPTYKGKSLVYWLNQLPCTTYGNRSYATYTPALQQDQQRAEEMQRQANEALDAIGTNCLPTLLSWLTYRDSHFVLTVRGWLNRLPWLRGKVLPTAYFRNGRAVTALWHLGERAGPIVPELLALAHRGDPALRSNAKGALFKVAPNECERLDREDWPVMSRSWVIITNICQPNASSNR